MAIQTDRSRSADAGAGAVLACAVERGWPRRTAAETASGSRAMSRLFSAAHRALRVSDLWPADPPRRQDAAAADHLRQHDRPRHPAQRHLLSEPVSCVADRGEARQPAGPGRSDCRRHRRQRDAREGHRPHRAQSGHAAGDRGRRAACCGTRTSPPCSCPSRPSAWRPCSRAACCRPTSARASMPPTAC